MTKRVLSVLLALVLMFSAIAEETPLAGTPVEEVKNEATEVVEEVVNEVAAANEEAKQADPVQEERAAETAQTADTDVRENGESAEPSKAEETVNEEAEVVPEVQEKPEENAEDKAQDIPVDTPESVEPAEEKSEEEQPEEKAETEDASNKTSSTEITVESEAIVVAPGEENKDEEETGSEDVGTNELGESDGKSKEEVPAETEEKQSEKSEKGESETAAVENESKMEAEEISTGSDLEGQSDKTGDEVSDGAAVLTETPAEEAMTFSMAPAIATSDPTPQITTHRTVQAYDRNGNAVKDNQVVYLYATDATSSDEFIFHAYTEDSIMEFRIWINNNPVKLRNWGLDQYYDYTKEYEYSFTYAKLYSMLSDGECTVKVRFHCNKDLDVYNIEKTVTFKKFYIDKPTITIARKNSNDVYPGDPVDFVVSNYTITRQGESVKDEVTCTVEWFVDGISNCTKKPDEMFTWTATDSGQHTVYAVLHVSY